jgi:hypothetical protein
MIVKMICIVSIFTLIIGKKCSNRVIYLRQDQAQEALHKKKHYIFSEVIRNRAENILMICSNMILRGSDGKIFKLMGINLPKELITQWCSMVIVFTFMVVMMAQRALEISTNATS